MDDLSKYNEQAKQEMHKVIEASKDGSPFLYGIGKSMAKGAGFGLVAGLFLTKSSKLRRVSMYYGAGFGLGMQSSQLHALWGALTDAEVTRDEAFARELSGLEMELKLRSKLK